LREHVLVQDGSDERCRRGLMLAGLRRPDSLLIPT